MTALRFTQFSGEVPKLQPRLLPDTAAQLAENVRLDDGALTPIRKPRLEFSFGSVPDAIQTIYKFGNTWLQWSSVVNAVPGPVATDRLYYTGDGAPKMRVGTTIYDLAVSAPTAALTAAVTGTGSGDVVTRLYVYTFVTDFGEESEPCPISADVNWQAGQTVTLSGFQAPPAGRAITKQRIYRSQSSSQSGTDLFFLEERTASTSNWVDTYAPDKFGEPLPSLDWNQPPADLQGLIAMPNGMMVGFTGKQICFCEPYHPHAWPEKYRLTTSYSIVGLGAYGNTLVAGTTGYPYIATGNAPEAMIEEKVEVNLPCVNGRGFVDLGYSVAYPSNDGLVVVSNGGATVVTDNLFTRAGWQKISPATLVASQFAGRYFASYYYQDITGTEYQGTLIIDLTNQQPFVVRSGTRLDAYFYDVTSGSLYFLLGSTVYEWDAVGQPNEIMSWKSKKVVLPSPASMGAILVEGSKYGDIEDEKAFEDALQAIKDYNAILFANPSIGGEIDGSEIDGMTIGGDLLKPLPVENFVSVGVYADGELIRVITELNKVLRIPARKAKIWEIQVNGSARVEQISIAATARELNEV